MPSLPRKKYILIVANSGRMLAQFAQKAGYSPVVIDCFSDVDTQTVALECIKVDNLALDFLQSPVLLLLKKYQLSLFIYGSGLECHLDSLEFLRKYLGVLGNEVDVFSAIQNKAAFFNSLERLSIPYPKTTLKCFNLKSEGLFKPMQGEGGVGIKKNSQLKEIPEFSYWQQYVEGTAMSALFITNGIQSKIYGFHKQWVATVGNNEFIFSGLISQPEIDDELKTQVSLWITKLVQDFSLKGINSLDFIVSENDCFVLELNTRPSASMQLYQNDLFSEHVKSVLSETIEPSNYEGGYHGYKIIFAETDIVIRNNIQWPVGVVDIPVAGSIIHTEMPICSIIARENSEQLVLDQIQSKQQLIKKLLQ